MGGLYGNFHHMYFFADLNYVNFWYSTSGIKMSKNTKHRPANLWKIKSGKHYNMNFVCGGSDHQIGKKNRGDGRSILTQS